MKPNFFRQHVDGVLGGMIKVLKDELSAPKGYVKEIAFYKGQFGERRDSVRETVKKVLGSLAGKTPLFIVAYAGGNNVAEPAAGMPKTEPRCFSHKCSFVVFAVDADPRGQESQVRGSVVHPGVFQMVGDALEHLSGLQVTDTTGATVFNPSGLTPSDVVVVDHLPNVAAYAVYFDTSFPWQTKPQQVAGVAVEELIFTAEVEGADATPRDDGEGVVVTVNQQS
jgi:hypothetical protein